MVQGKESKLQAAELSGGAGVTTCCRRLFPSVHSCMGLEGVMEGNGSMVSFWVNESVLILTVVMVAQLCEYASKQWI